MVFKDEKNQSKINVVKDEERKALLERGTLLYISSSPDPLFQPTLNIVYYFSRYYRYLQEKRAVNLDSENYYDLHPTQASRGLARVKTERMAGRQQVRGVPKTAR